MSTTTLGTYLKWAEAAFLKANLYFGHGTSNAWDEAVALALAVLQLPPDTDSSALNQELSAEEYQTLKSLAKRRIQDHIPVAYLTHEAWFAGLRFYVDERVIIPRSPLAELIQHEFKPWWPQSDPPQRILDLCTGSGCIAIACSQAFPEAMVDAIDISLEALAVAEKNVQLHRCADRVQLIHSDLFEACRNREYDIIISNPPYVSLQQIESLPAEYQWEPRLALKAEENGLGIVRRILKDALLHLATPGLLIVEVGNSETAVRETYPQLPFTWLEFERGGEGVFLLEKEGSGCWSKS